MQSPGTKMDQRTPNEAEKSLREVMFKRPVKTVDIIRDIDMRMGEGKREYWKT